MQLRSNVIANYESNVEMTLELFARSFLIFSMNRVGLGIFDKYRNWQYVNQTFYQFAAKELFRNVTKTLTP